MGVPGAKPTVVASLGLSTSRSESGPDPRDAGGDIVSIDTPETLSARGRDVWDLIVPPLLDAKVLRQDDLVLLVECAESWAASEHFRERMWDLIRRQDEIETNIDAGHLHGDDLKVALSTLELYDGQVKRARTAWQQSLRSAVQLGGELGLGPVARVRLGTAKVVGASLLDMLRAHREG